MKIDKSIDKTKKVLKEMMLEKTRTVLVDSGSVYGYHWQNNRSKADELDYMPLYKYKIYGDEVFKIVNVYPYLLTVIRRDKLSEEIEQKLYESCKNPYKVSEIEDFLVKNYGGCNVRNSFNYDGNLSQILQCFTFHPKPRSIYVALQIHNGCDARWGYTKPRIFKVIDDILFIHPIDIICECYNELYSDTGYIDIRSPEYKNRFFIHNRTLYCNCLRPLITDDSLNNTR